MKKLLFMTSILFTLVFNFAMGADSKGKEITFMVPEWGVPNEKMLDEFYKESGIKVNVETVSWDDIRDKISIAAVGKKAAADVVEVDWSWVGEFKSAGWLEPINLDKKDIEDIPSISSFTVNNQILAVPYANDFRIGYYNKNIYDKAGLKEPMTWSDVEKQMLTLKEKGILKYPYTLPLNATEGTTTAFLWLTYLRDGKVFNDDNTLNKENALSTLQFIDRAVKNNLINPANLTSKDSDTYRQLISGEAAFMVGPTRFIEKAFDSKFSTVVGQIEVIIPPGKDGKAKQTMALTEAIGISSLSKNKEAAATFVKWYSSKKMQKDFYKELSIIPTRTTVLEQLIASDDIKHSGKMKETAALVNSPFPAGVPKYYAEMSDIFCNAINKMASGTITPEQAVNEMDLKLKDLIVKNK